MARKKTEQALPPEVLSCFALKEGNPSTAGEAVLLDVVTHASSLTEAKCRRFRDRLERGVEPDAVQALSDEERPAYIDALLSVLPRIEATNASLRASITEQPDDESLAAAEAVYRAKHVLSALLGGMLQSKSDRFTASHIRQLAERGEPFEEIVDIIEAFYESNQLDDDTRDAIERMLASLQAMNDGHRYDLIDAIGRLEDLLLAHDGSSAAQWPMRLGEVWADAAFACLEELEFGHDELWLSLLNHCTRATTAKPSKAWMSEAFCRVDEIGEEEFIDLVTQLLPLVKRPRMELTPEDAEIAERFPNRKWLIAGPNTDILRGLAWCCSMFDDASIARVLADLAVATYRKIPGEGPRSMKVGNACLYALGMMPGKEGLAQLAILKSRIKLKTAQKGIEKALNTCAERLGTPRDELEELSVPTYGMTEVGLREELLAGYTAELIADGPKPRLEWLRPDGKSQKTVPKVVKEQCADELKELKQTVKDIEKMLPAQAARLEQTYLARRQWDYATWRQRYYDHPLVGIHARRLIWLFQSGEEIQSAIWWAGDLVDAQNESIGTPPDDTTVRLWHPLDEEATDAVVAWREWLDERRVRQPFKQAHREIYLLTDAERTTSVYSNRFAAHILKQHQYHALCQARGWNNTLRLCVDDTYPPSHLLLPSWNLRAEFWVQGVGEEWGVDTTEAGTYLYLATDQVRFYRDEAAMNSVHASGGAYSSTGADEPENNPLELAQVPPLVFSEVMRDVDLFVGVASVGNDPEWSDGGPQGRYRDYWQDYAFGELGATATTRKEVLERLIPRLKIAERCSFSERFLIVRGDLRTYRIHLGSGNILMAPNDEYLCIVPNQSTAKKSVSLFLPFEGDRTLSIILSKALLLAEDAKISDDTIVNQIRS